MLTLTEDDCAQDRPEVEGQTRLKEVPHQTEGEADHKTSHCPHDDLDGSLGIHTTILMVPSVFMVPSRELLSLHTSEDTEVEPFVTRLFRVFDQHMSCVTCIGPEARNRAAAQSTDATPRSPFAPALNAWPREARAQPRQSPRGWNDGGPPVPSQQRSRG